MYLTSKTRKGVRREWVGKVIRDDVLEMKKGKGKKWHRRVANQNLGVLKSKAHCPKKIKLV